MTSDLPHVVVFRGGDRHYVATWKACISMHGPDHAGQHTPHHALQGVQGQIRCESDMPYAHCKKRLAQTPSNFRHSV